MLQLASLSLLFCSTLISFDKNEVASCTWAKMLLHEVMALSRAYSRTRDSSTRHEHDAGDDDCGAGQTEGTEGIVEECVTKECRQHETKSDKGIGLRQLDLRKGIQPQQRPDAVQRQPAQNR